LGRSGKSDAERLQLVGLAKMYAGPAAIAKLPSTPSR
jgi:hypothetical protein